MAESCENLNSNPDMCEWRIEISGDERRHCLFESEGVFGSMFIEIYGL